jgi:peptidoglycan/xylan/chitin deacetylase (PgdA/CDA1 family)
MHLRKNKSKKLFNLCVFALIQFFFVFVFLQNYNLLSQVSINLIKESILPAYKVAAEKNNKESVNQINVKPAQSIPVLVYHGIVETPDDSNILIQDFRNQMFLLKEKGYQTITISELYDYMKGKRKIPAKSFLLTFDDGRKDSYYPVDPILESLGFNAVIFIISDHAFAGNSNYYLTKKELQEMVKSGRWEVQAHTKAGHDLFKISKEGDKGHFFSNKLWLDGEDRLETDEEYRRRVSKDMHGVKSDIENNLNNQVTSFAYPFGDYGQGQKNHKSAADDLLEIVNADYKMFFVQLRESEVFSHNVPNVNTGSAIGIKRIDINPTFTLSSFQQKIENGETKDIPFNDNFSENRGWVKTAGELQFEKVLKLISTSDRTSASASLDGTLPWTNYSFSADVSVIKGESVSLLSRYNDRSSYLSCNYTENYASIKQKKDEIEIILAETKGKIKNDARFAETDLSNIRLSMDVKNNQIICKINNEELISTDSAAVQLFNGGIGIQSWDKKVNNSEVVVKKVDVTAL